MKKIHVFEGGWMVVDIFFYNINRAQFNVVEKNLKYLALSSLNNKTYLFNCSVTLKYSIPESIPTIMQN